MAWKLWPTAYQVTLIEFEKIKFAEDPNFYPRLVIDYPKNRQKLFQALQGDQPGTVLLKYFPGSPLSVHLGLKYGKTNIIIPIPIQHHLDLLQGMVIRKKTYLRLFEPDEGTLEIPLNDCLVTFEQTWRQKVLPAYIRQVRTDQIDSTTLQNIIQALDEHADKFWDASQQVE